MEVSFLSNQEITNKNNKIDLKVDSESGHHFHFYGFLLNSTKLKYNHTYITIINTLNSTKLNRILSQSSIRWGLAWGLIVFNQF